MLGRIDLSASVVSSSPWSRKLIVLRSTGSGRSITFFLALGQTNFGVSSAIAMEEQRKHKDDKNKYSIIVPTYNERLNIALLVYLVFKHLRYSLPLPPSLYSLCAYMCWQFLMNWLLYILDIWGQFLNLAAVTDSSWVLEFLGFANYNFMWLCPGKGFEYHFGFE